MPAVVEYFNIIYVDARESATLIQHEWSSSIEDLRRWTWERCAIVRWHRLAFESREPHVPPNLVVIMDEPNRIGLPAQVAWVRRVLGPIPLLCLTSDPGKSLQTIPIAYRQAVALIKDSFTEPLELVLNHLQVVLKPIPPNLMDFDREDWALQILFEHIPESDLNILVAKLFPDATSVTVRSVRGGWSGIPLCHLVVEGDPNLYYFKFFRDSSKYTNELQHHGNARAWLGDATVDLHPVPAMEPTDYLAFLEAGLAPHRVHPNALPFRIPVCYESANNAHNSRKTLQEFYLDHPDVSEVIEKVLRILARVPSTIMNGCIPWPPESPYTPNAKVKARVREALMDLDAYGVQLYGNVPVNWNNAKNAIQNAVYGPRPSWLLTARSVMIGDIHGDPNCRNILVNPENLTDLKLIDCGDYRSDGRLVHDLALIEWDAKCVLMATEDKAPGFKDLDTSQLVDWCLLEKSALDHGLDLNSETVTILTTKAEPCMKRAYQIVEMVRQRARVLCQAAGDFEGHHYFASLLYWTLRSLGEPGVRRAKKLLAIHSAASILARWP